MEKLVEVSHTEVLINFTLKTKCRATVTLKSLSPTTPIAFKIQTSSPHKFLVNPPTGLIPPLTSTTFQIILKPQTHLPPTYPRSSSDRFLIKTAPFKTTTSSSLGDSINLNTWFSSVPLKSTQDAKLKVAFVGPFLLHHAVKAGDLNSVKNILKRQKDVLTELSPKEAESLLRVATKLGGGNYNKSSEEMVNLLLEAGLSVVNKEARGEFSKRESNGWNELHVAVVDDRTEEVLSLVGKGFRPLDLKDKDGRTALHLAVSKGNLRCARVLVESGADKDVRSKDGRTPLHRAISQDDRRMVEMLVEMGADPTVTDARGRTAVDVARDKGLVEIMRILERGELIVRAARRGELERLEWLLQKGANPSYCDQYGFTALHIASIKGLKDIVSMLVEYGIDLECQDNEGHTPLHLAVESCSLETVEVLINGGANVNAKTKRGVTPLHIAKAIGCDDILHLLIDRGAFSSPSSSLFSSLSSGV